MNSNKIKKIIYSILKEILEGDSIPTASDYEITEDQFFEIINLMKNENYLNPKKVTFFVTGDFLIQKSIDTVTMKGIEFLEQNNKWSKVYKGIKEFREFLPI
ncbi:MAG: YjcQ family protein [Mycoplasmatota bacterium]|nr:YjcQ family protein [Mycoplasmatota bacterium]